MRSLDHARVGRAAVGVGALVLVVANAVTVLTPASVHTGRGTGAGAAVVRALDEVFLTGHMFASSIPVNTDVWIEGRRVRSEASEPARWEPLAVDELFVFDVPGDRVARLYAARAQLLHGAAGQRAAWSELAARIVRRHDLLHPDAPIDAVRFGIEQWPKDPRGYEARRRPGEVRRVAFFAWERP